MAEIISDEDAISINNKMSKKAFGYVAKVLTPEDVFSFSFEEDFSKAGWSSEDADGDGNSWGRYEDKQFARTGENLAINHPNMSMGTNDWLYSNPIKVKAGVLYRVSFYIMKYQLPNEGLEVAFGSEKDLKK